MSNEWDNFQNAVEMDDRTSIGTVLHSLALSLSRGIIGVTAALNL